jgi:hypothetical protein
MSLERSTEDDNRAFLNTVADRLLRTVEAAEPVLRGLTDNVVSARPSPDRWTIQEVVGHLIDSAANNHQRFVRAQSPGEFVFPKYEQNEWVSRQRYDTAIWSDVITLWAAYNRHLAHVMRHVAPASLETRCVIGPYEPVTLGYLIEDYVTHLRHHLRKVGERVGLDLVDAART